MGLENMVQFDSMNRLIPLTMIPLSGTHCTNLTNPPAASEIVTVGVSRCLWSLFEAAQLQRFDCTLKPALEANSEQQPPVYKDQNDAQFSKTDSNFIGTNFE